ncbi:MAG TPA: HAD-IC family P-type ATPase, partial [Rhodopila sp.]|nr:HAD-IC family P-type ATPase [Rhodopila sp.]
GIESMRKEGVLVRRLHALETLANVGAVCFDKTGTLTLNQMRVAEVVTGGRHLRADADGRLYGPDGDMPDTGANAEGELVWLLRVAALCSDAELALSGGQLVPVGSATEGALVRLSLASGLDVVKLRESYPRLAVRHRAEGYRYMATAHRRPVDDVADGALIAVKGSPAEVLALCGWELHDGKPRRLTAARREAIGRINATMAADALRVLGFAVGATNEGALEQDDGGAVWPSTGLTWVGMAGMADPIRPGMTDLIRTLHEAGLRTVMMTGDQVPTAMAVARQLRLAGDHPVQILDVAALDQLSDEELASAVRRAHGFARVSPADKMRLVRVLQKAGDRIAMTGDGINDSPALRAADVGLAMGGSASSQAAREVADVVLLTDELTTLADAIERGRTTFVNVRKSIRYLLATNLSEILVVLGATAAGYGEPLTAMQLLWINLVSDVLPGLGLAFEPPGPGLMHRPPNGAAGAIMRRDEWGRMGAQAGVIASGSLAALGVGALRHGIGAEGRTMAFGSLVTAQLLHALSARSERHGLFIPGSPPLSANPPLRRLLLGSVAFQAVALLVPGVRDMLGLVRLDPVDLAVTAGAGVLPYLANEVMKIGHAEAGLATEHAADVPA